MAKVRFMLNTRKPQNFAYFEPMSRLHVTRKKVIDAIEEKFFNINIVNAIKNGTIVDIDNRVDLEKGVLIELLSPEIKTQNIENDNTDADENEKAAKASETKNEKKAEAKKETKDEEEKKAKSTNKKK